MIRIMFSRNRQVFHQPVIGKIPRIIPLSTVGSQYIFLKSEKTVKTVFSDLDFSVNSSGFDDAPRGFGFQELAHHRSVNGMAAFFGFDFS